MNRYYVLTKVMLKNFNLLFLKPDKIGRKQIKGILLSILIIVAMIPTMFGIADDLCRLWNAFTVAARRTGLRDKSVHGKYGNILFQYILCDECVLFFKGYRKSAAFTVKTLRDISRQVYCDFDYEYVYIAILLLPALIGYGVAGKLAVSCRVQCCCFL